MLGALDDKIEQNRRTSASLERLARAVFRTWLVDFEPVKAKAAGATGFPSMPQEVYDGLPSRLVDSELGPVPEGWKVGTVGDGARISKVQVKPLESEGNRQLQTLGVRAMSATTAIQVWRRHLAASTAE